MCVQSEDLVRLSENAKRFQGETSSQSGIATASSTELDLSQATVDGVATWIWHQEAPSFVDVNATVPDTGVFRAERFTFRCETIYDEVLLPPLNAPSDTDANAAAAAAAAFLEGQPAGAPVSGALDGLGAGAIAGIVIAALCTLPLHSPVPTLFSSGRAGLLAAPCGSNPLLTLSRPWCSPVFSSALMSVGLTGTPEGPHWRDRPVLNLNGRFARWSPRWAACICTRCVCGCRPGAACGIETERSGPRFAVCRNTEVARYPLCKSRTCCPALPCSK